MQLTKLRTPKLANCSWDLPLIFFNSRCSLKRLRPNDIWLNDEWLEGQMEFGRLNMLVTFPDFIHGQCFSDLNLDFKYRQFFQPKFQMNIYSIQLIYCVKLSQRLNFSFTVCPIAK